MPKFNYRTQKIIDSLSKSLDLVESRWPMKANYQRCEPYVVPYLQCGKWFELIIYHTESREWFDCAQTDIILNFIRQNKMISDTEIVFDIGCNAGAITVAMASQCAKGGMVHSFDPYPWNAIATYSNAQLNGLTNVITYAVGLSNRDYAINVGEGDARSFVADESVNAHEITIHDFAKYKNLNPTFMKIDIEGSEHDLFSGAGDLVDKFSSVSAFVLEFHPFWIRPRGIDPKESLKGIENAGFDLSYYNPDGPKYDIESFRDEHHLFWGKPSHKT